MFRYALILLSFLLSTGYLLAEEKLSAKQLLQLVDSTNVDYSFFTKKGEKRYKDASSKILEKDLSVLYQYSPVKSEFISYPWLVNTLEGRLYAHDLQKHVNRRLNHSLSEIKFNRDKPPFGDLSIDETPNLDGATSTLPMRTIILSYMLGIESGWQEHFRLDETSKYPHIPIRYENNFPKVRYQLGDDATNIQKRRWALLCAENTPLTPNSQTGAAYQQLLKNRNMLVINSVSPEAVAALTEKDFEEKFGLTTLFPDKGEIFPRESLDQLEYKIIAYDALVAVVHVSNPVESITLEQIKKIYTMPKIQSTAEIPAEVAAMLSTLTWKDIDSKGLSIGIMPLDRNPNSGTGILMRNLIFRGSLPGNSNRIHKEFTMRGIFDALNSYHGALGFSVFYFEQNIHPVPYSKNLAINGVKPTNETIADGSYPLRAPIYAAIRRDTPADSSVRRIYDFLTTPEGQTVIEAAGYVPLTPVKR